MLSKIILKDLILTAQKSNLKQKHSSVAIRNGKLITPLFYNYKRNNILGKRCCSAHSEICVINYLLNSLWYNIYQYSIFYILFQKNIDNKKLSKIRKKFSQIDLVVIKYSKNKLGMSKPCLDCLKIIKIVGIKNIIYSDSKGNIVSEKTNKMETSHLSKAQKNQM